MMPERVMVSGFHFSHRLPFSTKPASVDNPASEDPTDPRLKNIEPRLIELILCEVIIEFCLIWSHSLHCRLIYTILASWLPLIAPTLIDMSCLLRLWIMVPHLNGNILLDWSLRRKPLKRLSYGPCCVREYTTNFRTLISLCI